MLPKIILKYEGIEMIANTKDKVKNAPTGFDNEKEDIGIFLSINLFPKSKKKSTVRTNMTSYLNKCFQHYIELFLCYRLHEKNKNSAILSHPPSLILNELSYLIMNCHPCMQN